MRALMWFRSDLRVSDNPALHHACAESTRGVAAVFVICPEQWQAHDWADVKVEFILRNLRALKADLHKLKVPLLIETVDAFDDVPDLLLDLAGRHECDTLVFNREYEVNERKRDREVAVTFERAGLAVQAFTDQVVVPPGSVRTGKGDFYTVFTPFKKAWIDRVEKSGDCGPLGKPKAQSSFVTGSDDVPDEVDGFDASAGLPDLWPEGETEARRRLRRFVRQKLDAYKNDRDFPDRDGTSCLSPYLAAGAISIRQCLAAAVEANGGSLNGRKTGAATWISELIWREFYRHVLVGYPRVSKHRAFKPETEKLAWSRSEKSFEAWCEGRTGVPIVDAAMRQLLETGWMHNRLRMITAMYLTKDLFIDWRRGEQHFMRHLIDGDLASNNGGWQWSASTGTDAAPYFRIFNPYSQSAKFDPDGSFIRRHVPELADVPTEALHDPDKLTAALRKEAGYPEPIADRKGVRERVMKAFKALG